MADRKPAAKDISGDVIERMIAALRECADDLEDAERAIYSEYETRSSPPFKLSERLVKARAVLAEAEVLGPAEMVLQSDTGGMISATDIIADHWRKTGRAKRTLLLIHILDQPKEPRNG